MMPLLFIGVLLLNLIGWVCSIPIIWYFLLNIMIGIGMLCTYLLRLHRRILQLLQLTTVDILTNDNLPQILTRVEKRIEELLNSGSVYIYWQNDLMVRDWTRGYYHFTLQEKEQFDHTMPARITIDSFYGEQISFYYYPIVLKGVNYGSILIPLRRFQTISKIVQWFLKHVSILLIDQFQQLQAKSKLAVTVQQELQKRVAQDMHDGLAQKLFFLSAQLFSIKNELRPRITDVELVRMKKLAQHVDESVAEVRNYMWQLRETAWQTDLFQKLEQLLHTKSINTGLNVHLDTSGLAINESNDVLKAIYHFVDESTTNVIKHAKATKIHVQLDVTPIQWIIKISDDGIGMKSAQQKRKNDRLGLVGIEERIKDVGGFISIRSDEGIGTELISIIPRINQRERGSIIGI